MSQNLLEMSRQLRLYVPQLPITLAEQFIRDRYRRILRRRDWSGLRREAQFLLRDAKQDGTVDVLFGDDVVVGNGTTFDADDVGRQFKVGSGSPVYTITAVDVGAQELTLNMEVGIADAAGANYWIMDAYVTPPANFKRFLVITNPLYGWRLNHWATQGELDLTDPQRTFTGQPYVLADRMYTVATEANANDYRPQYEAWPYATSQQTLYYMYLIDGADLISGTDQPIYPIPSDAIVAGALADLAMWPGTLQHPNPYFQSTRQSAYYEAKYEDMMIEVERQDEEVFLSMLEMYPQFGFPLSPFTFSASFLQSHAI